MTTPSRLIRGCLSPGLYRALAWALALCTCGLALGVIASWALHEPPLTNTRVHWMNPLSAVSLCIAGVLIALANRPLIAFASNTIILAGSSLLFFIGLSAVVRDTVGFDPCLDLMLFNSRLDDGLHPPSRMPSSTSHGLILIAAALFALRKSDTRALVSAAVFSAAVFALGILGIIGYVTGISSLPGVASRFMMSLHSSIGFIFASSGTLCCLIARALSRRGAPRIVSGVPNRWSILSVQRISGVGFAVALASLAILGVVSAKSLNILLVRARYNIDARHTLDQFRALDSAVQSLQTASYRYLLSDELTGDNTSAASDYRTAQLKLWAALGELDRSAAIVQQSLALRPVLDEIDELVRQHTARITELRAPAGSYLHTPPAIMPAFTRNLEEARSRIALLAAAHSAAIDQRRDSSLAIMRVTEIVITLGSVLSLLIVGGVAWLLRRITSDLHRTQAEAAKLSIVASQTENMVVITDAGGRIEWVNESFTRQTGYVLADVSGKMSTQFLHVPLTDPAVAADIGDHIAQGRAFSGEVVRYTKPGRPLHVALDMHLIHDERGELVNLVWVERDITEARREQESLSFLAAIVRCSDDAIISEDLSGRITSWNTAAERLLGYSAAEVLGRSIAMLAPPDRADEVRGLLRRLRAGEHVTHFETVRQAKDGRRLDVLLTLSPILNAAGTIIGFSEIARDITDRKQHEADLRQARAAAEAASRSKSEFLAHMSHEIRTPLNGVVGMIDLLLTTPPQLDERQAGYAQLAKSSAESLSKIVNDILDFSKIEAGKLDIVPDDFHLHTLCRKTIELLSHKAAEQGVSMVCEIAPGVPDEVCADPDRLRQVLFNLLNNAVKFTRQGSITLRLSPESRLGSRAVLRFEIIDTGIGISPSRIDRLFKAFSQADSSTTRTFGGTGLGLVISKQLVELMGGSIGVSSNLGHGSTFWFTIGVECRPPAAQPEPSPPPAPAPPSNTAAAFKVVGNSSASDAGVSPARVLLAEDNQVNQIVARELLIKSGFTCDIVADGQAAVDAVKSTDYALLFMDCEMPVLDGFQATRLIREREHALNLPRLPIVALTANAMTADRQQCLDAGMDAYISKPVNIRELLDVLHKHARVAPPQPLTKAA